MPSSALSLLLFLLLHGTEGGEDRVDCIVEFVAALHGVFDLCDTEVPKSSREIIEHCSSSSLSLVGPEDDDGGAVDGDDVHENDSSATTSF